MRSIKSVLSLAVAAVLVAALAVPAAASASNWKEGGSEIKPSPTWLKGGVQLEELVSVPLAGNIDFTGPAGGTKCTAGGAVTLPTGEFTSVELSPGKCTPTGAVSTCKITSVSSALPTINPREVEGKRDAVISGVQLTYKYEGFLCPKEIKLTGSLTATPDNSAAITKLTLSGVLKASLGENATVSGSLSPSPAGKYGIGTVKTLTLTGSISGSGPVGGFECGSVSGSMNLEPGSKGQLTGLNWNAGCKTTGGYAGCNVVSGAATSLPWTIEDEGTRIKINDLGYTLHSTNCGDMYVTGDDTLATPNSTSAISSLSFAGQTGTSWGQGWKGSFTVSPAGVYGL